MMPQPEWADVMGFPGVQNFAPGRHGAYFTFRGVKYFFLDPTWALFWLNRMEEKR